MGKKDKCIWTLQDELELLKYLEMVKSEGGDGGNFKSVTLTAAAAAVNKTLS